MAQPRHTTRGRIAQCAVRNLQSKTLEHFREKPTLINPSQQHLGFGKQLSLSYDSGRGNSPFGFGWSLALPEITRKTDKGLPQYKDEEESDIFILSGAEDLMPQLVQSGTEWTRDIPPVRAVYGQQY